MGGKSLKLFHFAYFKKANHPTEKFKPQRKARGKSSSLRRYLRKQTNVVDEKREAKAKLVKVPVEPISKPKTALDRFTHK